MTISSLLYAVAAKSVTGCQVFLCVGTAVESRPGIFILKQEKAVQQAFSEVKQQVNVGNTHA
jgi:hypothetical protein